MYAVLYRNGRDDDTEELYTDTSKNACRLYLRGWIDAFLSHTAYTQEIEDGNIIFISPLVSESRITVWIEEKPEEYDEEENIPF